MRPRSIVLVKHLECARVAVTVDENDVIWLDLRASDSTLAGIEILITRSDIVEFIGVLSDTLRLVTKP